MKTKLIIAALIFGFSIAAPALAVDKYPDGYKRSNISEKVWVLQSMDGLEEGVFPGTLRIVTRSQNPTSIVGAVPDKTIDSIYIESCGLCRWPAGQADRGVSRLKYINQCEGTKTDVATDVTTVRSRYSKIISEYGPDLLKSRIDWDRNILTVVSAEGEELALFILETPE